jgi:hypothetical protein
MLFASTTWTLNSSSSFAESFANRSPSRSLDIHQPVRALEMRTAQLCFHPRRPFSNAQTDLCWKGVILR